MQEHFLVTGGAGYIGSHTCKALSDSGFVPVTIDNLVYGHRQAVKWGPFFEGDLSDVELVRRVIAEFEIQAVVHFGAYAYVGESTRDPGKYFDNNVIKTLRLLQTIVEHGVRHFVFSSSCATYGIPDAIPISEDQPQKPVNPYGESKLFVERALHWYGVAHGLRCVALRYFNAAGASDDAEIGESHDPETHLIPLVLRAAAGITSHVEIYGSDYPTSDGTAIRDYIHVTDLAQAHVAALQHLQRGGESVALNLGTGRGYSVREVITTTENVVGRTVPVVQCPRRPGDPPELVADARRAGEVLGWQPRHSSLENIIATAWRWHQACPAGSR